MKCKVGDLVVGIAGLVNLGCIIGLARIGLKRNDDCYKAECGLIEAEYNLAIEKINNIKKDAEIRKLENVIKQLKGETEES